jgi:polysaccharide export outer membrane protein
MPRRPWQWWPICPVSCRLAVELERQPRFSDDKTLDVIRARWYYSCELKRPDESLEPPRLTGKSMIRLALALLALTPGLGLEAGALRLTDLLLAPQTAVPQSAPAQAGALPALGQAQAAPAAQQPNPPVDPATYQIGPQDVVEVRVWNEPQLSGALTVRADGKISIQFIGDIQAVGRTPEQLSNDISVQLLKLIKDPHVSVAVQAQRSKKYQIQGNVRAPGDHYLIGPTTVLQALVGAAFGDFADQKNIVIARGAKRLKFNYKEVINGKRLEQNIFLEPDDIIIVK